MCLVLLVLTIFLPRATLAGPMAAAFSQLGVEQEDEKLLESENQ